MDTLLRKPDKREYLERVRTALDSFYEKERKKLEKKRSKTGLVRKKGRLL